MKVRVKLFAVARQRIGRDTLEIELPDQSTIRHLRQALLDQFPPLASVVPHARFAINSEYASDATAVPAVAEVAIIPPVSGG